MWGLTVVAHCEARAAPGGPGLVANRAGRQRAATNLENLASATVTKGYPPLPDVSSRPRPVLPAGRNSAPGSGGCVRGRAAHAQWVRAQLCGRPWAAAGGGGPWPPLRPPEPAGAGTDEGPWVGSTPRSCPASPSRPSLRPRSPSTGFWTSRRRSRAPGQRPSRTASRVSGSQGVVPARRQTPAPRPARLGPRCGPCWPRVSDHSVVQAPRLFLQGP